MDKVRAALRSDQLESRAVGDRRVMWVRDVYEGLLLKGTEPVPGSQQPLSTNPVHF